MSDNNDQYPDGIYWFQVIFFRQIFVMSKNTQIRDFEKAQYAAYRFYVDLIGEVILSRMFTSMSNFLEMHCGTGYAEDED